LRPAGRKKYPQKKKSTMLPQAKAVFAGIRIFLAH
jgi:hypothetical protein